VRGLRARGSARRHQRSGRRGTLFIRPSQTHRRLQIGRRLKLDVGAQWLTQARREEVDLLWHRQTITAAQQREELLLVLLDRSGAVQVLEFGEPVGADGRAETQVDEVGETRPRDDVVVPLDGVVPLGRDAVEVQRGEPHLLHLQGAHAPEVGLALGEPREWIGLTIVLGEGDLGEA